MPWRQLRCIIGQQRAWCRGFYANTFEELQKKAAETLRFHVKGMLEDGDDVPQWLVDGDYDFEYIGWKS